MYLCGLSTDINSALFPFFISQIFLCDFEVWKSNMLRKKERKISSASSLILSLSPQNFSLYCNLSHLISSQPQNQKSNLRMKMKTHHENMKQGERRIIPNGKNSIDHVQLIPPKLQILLHPTHIRIC